jgi:hypothetical protein
MVVTHEVETESYGRIRFLRAPAVSPETSANTITFPD